MPINPDTLVTSVPLENLNPCDPCYHPNFFPLSEPFSVIANETLLPLDATVPGNWTTQTLVDINLALDLLGNGDQIETCATGLVIRGGAEPLNYPASFLDTALRPSGNVFVANGRPTFTGALNLSRAQNFTGDLALLSGIPLLVDRQLYMDGEMHHDNGYGLVPLFGPDNTKALYWINRQNNGLVTFILSNILIIGWVK